MTSEAYRQNYLEIDWTKTMAWTPKRRPPPHANGPTVIPDIEPYQSVIDGSIISGRRQHRDHLRAHGCIEVGNEKLKAKDHTVLPPVMDDIKAAIDMVRQGYKPPKIGRYEE